METGNCSPEIENSSLETLASVKVTASVLTFVTDAGCEIFLPTPVTPKSTVAGVTCTADWLVFGWAFTMPVHPLSPSRGIMAAKHARTSAGPEVLQEVRTGGREPLLAIAISPPSFIKGSLSSLSTWNYWWV